MKFKFYLRMVGPERVVGLFNGDSAWPQASTRSLRRDVAWPPKEGAPPSWIWQTQVAEAPPDELEKAVAQFLQKCSPLAHIIAKHRNALEWASLVIVGECEESEVPNGLYFSVDMISSIQRLGVDLDIDFARVGAAALP